MNEINKPMPLAGQPGGPLPSILVFHRPGAPACVPVFGRYRDNNQLALQLYVANQQDDDDGLWATASVNLTPYGAQHPGEWGMWLKGWSENEGLPEALVKSGLLTLTGARHPTGFVHAEQALLTPAGILLCRRQMSQHPERFGIQVRS